MRELIDIWVEGHPRTKGSLKPIKKPGGGYRMIEQVAESGIWRTKVKETVLAEIADHLGKVDGKDRWRLREGWPIRDRPVIIAAEFYFDRPGANVDVYPTNRHFGDLDKLLRNVFDALQDAGLYKDDAQVAGILEARKRFALPGGAGARVRVWEGAIEA